ncbi:MAG: Rpn family recombination-promoting nuclease/putative transposase [Bacteroidales bacterium]|nr:Rpn family recombination-promoting nuclease/putative transposase [Bacteroidales bacterium]
MMEKNENKYIRFDWAMKRLLRNKANYTVLEGFLTTLLNEKITIKEMLESESNQESANAKSNRVDMLALNSKNELILIEVQNNNEYAYFQRMLFGTSKLVTQYIERGDPYEKIRKIYSVNIVYFDLGHGKDYVYHGKTEFRGIHYNDVLELTPYQRQTFDADSVSQLYPEYYILKVNDFDKVAKTPLEEWLYYLHTGKVPGSATAPGLKEVREKLQEDSMTESERKAYYNHIDNLVSLRDTIVNSRAEAEWLGREKGFAEGHAEGRAEGRAEGEQTKALEIARILKTKGLSSTEIAETTGLPADAINTLTV